MILIIVGYAVQHTPINQHRRLQYPIPVKLKSIMGRAKRFCKALNMNFISNADTSDYSTTWTTAGYEWIKKVWKAYSHTPDVLA